MTTVVRLLRAAFDPIEELHRFTAEAEGHGAIASFSGIARSTGKDGSPIDALVLESYRSVTLSSMESIAADAHTRFDLIRSLVLHRSGRILPNEAIVFVATASAHRRAAFDAADYLIDRLKSEAIFWKREDGPTGSRWIEPTAVDAADLARWHGQHGNDHVRQ